MFQKYKNIYGALSTTYLTSTFASGKEEGKMKSYIYHMIGKSKSNDNELDRYLNTYPTSSYLPERLYNLNILNWSKSKE